MVILLKNLVNTPMRYFYNKAGKKSYGESNPGFRRERLTSQAAFELSTYYITITYGMMSGPEHTSPFMIDSINL